MFCEPNPSYPNTLYGPIVVPRLRNTTHNLTGVVLRSRNVDQFPSPLSLCPQAPTLYVILFFRKRFEKSTNQHNITQDNTAEV